MFDFRPDRFRRDLSASFLVFLVALPLCLGIAIASGMPPAAGLVTGIVGGMIAGPLGGSVLQVSGPAAGLTVLVFELVQHFGPAALGPVVLAAGLLQILGGVARIGAWVRAIPVPVVEGMLAAIGLILVSAQLHVLVDAGPRASFFANLATLPGLLGPARLPPLAVGLATIAVMLGWERLRPPALAAVPGALLGVVGGTLVSFAAGPEVAARIIRVQVPGSLAAVVSLPSLHLLGQALRPSMLAAAFSVALIASIESLLSAAAIARMQPGPRTDYNRELMAQGVGNAVCGLLGALPMTGVIVRSSANVQAGARTRMAAVLHGLWLLLFVALLPAVLRLVPTAALAAVLVVVGLRLVSLRHARGYWRDGLAAFLPYVVTVGVILARNLLVGVVAGTAAALLLRALAARRRRAA